jgi:hypothetical protein
VTALVHASDEAYSCVYCAQHAGDGQYAAHGVAVKLQLPVDGADTPVLGQVQAQYLGAKFGDNDHPTTTGCGAKTLAH